MTENRPWRKADYLKYFEDFLDRHPEMNATRLSYSALGRATFMSILRRGVATPRFATIEQVVDFIEQYEKAVTQ